MPISPHFDEQEFEQTMQAAEEFATDLDEKEAQHNEQQALQEQKNAQRAEELKDSHSAKEASEIGLKENVKELSTA